MLQFQLRLAYSFLLIGKPRNAKAALQSALAIANVEHSETRSQIFRALNFVRRI